MSSPSQPLLDDILSTDEMRIAVAIRELRRGSGMQAFRDRIYGDQPLELGQIDALQHIVSLGAASMGEVAVALRVDASTATRAVAKLVKAGLVERRRAEADQRTVVVVATERGERLARDLRTRAHEALHDLFSEFEADDLASLAELMDRLVTALDRFVRT